MPTATSTRRAGYHFFTLLVTTTTRMEPGAEVFAALFEDTHVELIDDLLADASGGDQPGLAQDGQMTRDGGPGGIEVLGDLAGGAGPVAQQPQDVPSGRIGEGAEGLVHC